MIRQSEHHLNPSNLCLTMQMHTSSCTGCKLIGAIIVYDVISKKLGRSLMTSLGQSFIMLEHHLK